MQVQTQPGKPALQNGLLFGVILGAIEVAFTLTLGNLGFLICLVIYLGLVWFAGYRASARTGKVSTGLVAGLLAGLFSSIMGCLALFLYILPNVDAFRQALQQNATNFNQGYNITYTNSLVIGIFALVLVFVIIGSSVLALGIGAIGGAMGKGKAPASQYPYPGQYPDPRYMPPPAYPPQEYVPPPDSRHMPPPAYPPQQFTPPQMYPPLPESYPPKPQDYMPSPQENKQDGA